MTDKAKTESSGKARKRLTLHVAPESDRTLIRYAGHLAEQTGQRVSPSQAFDVAMTDIAAKLNKTTNRSKGEQK